MYPCQLPLNTGQTPVSGAQPCEVRELHEADRACVLELLAQDAERNVLLRSKLMDHGMNHPIHRGRFFGYFTNGQLAGVALLGHHILLACPDEAIPMMARMAVEHQVKGHLILGPRAQVQAMWNELALAGWETRLVHEQLWYVCQQPQRKLERMQLTQASLEHLDAVSDAQAEMALEASGVDPRVSDPVGFRMRTAERIERGRIWVKIADGKVVFKADIIGDTPETAYLEGVWTHPEYRGRGIGKSCMTELTHRLLRTRLSLTLLVDAGETTARGIYESVGFMLRDTYEARFVKSNNSL
ncbi:MAG: GNAT family N-acetyltransferase [Blastocatellia bacterium]